jgi:hypothetical protein
MAGGTTKETGEAEHGKATRKRDSSADGKFINALGNLVALAYPTMKVTECKPVLKALGVPQRCVDDLGEVSVKRIPPSVTCSLPPSVR